MVFAVAGTLCVGKEGPLAHIGGNCGAVALYLVGPTVAFLHNDHKKRQFISAGASAGVSIAFGAPIGGTLFFYELTKPNPYWKFSMLWKTFLCCATAVFTMAFLEGLLHGKLDSWSTSTVKFGTVRVANIFVVEAPAIKPAAAPAKTCFGLF